jgi:hypothetical protein
MAFFVNAVRVPCFTVLGTPRTIFEQAGPPSVLAVLFGFPLNLARKGNDVF